MAGLVTGSVNLWPQNTELVLSQDDETALPSAHVLDGENLSDRGRESAASGLTQPHEEDPAMRAGPEPPHIREIQILRDEEPALSLRSLPNSIIHVPLETLFVDGMHVMPQTVQLMGESGRQVLVQLDLQWKAGTARRGRSSAAEAAANAMMALTLSSLKDGKSSRIS